ncbi:MAG: NAD-dependent epimerase/dehydratase family protein [Oligoflexia bacterium]|nr:NAD-dependent epimerase/dehydratase family protein [Oligoflexia bacterium]
MKVLVTGATGFIGANVVRHLLARGDQVRCLVRKPNALLDGLDVELSTAPLVPREPSELAELLAAVDGCEGIFHIAGVYENGPAARRKMRDVHVYGTRALCDVAVRAGVRRLVLCSSSVTVGFGSRDAPGDEDTPLDPTPVYGSTGPLRWYYDTKFQAEELATGWGGVEVVVVNPDFVVGAFDIKPTSGQLILTMARHWLPVYPLGGKCFIDADDCAVAHLAAMDRGLPGRRYLLGNENLSYREMMGLVAQVVGRRPPILPLSTAALRVGAAGLDLLAALKPHGAERPDRRVLLSMQEARYRSGARARRELGMPATPLRDSIDKAYRWFCDQGYC